MIYDKPPMDGLDGLRMMVAVGTNLGMQSLHVLRYPQGENNFIV